MTDEKWKQEIIDKVWFNIQDGESKLCMDMLNLAEEHFKKLLFSQD